MRLFLFMLVAGLATAVRAASPSYDAFDQDDFTVGPNSITAGPSIAHIDSESFTGVTQVAYLLAGFADVTPTALGTLTNGATVTLSSAANVYSVTNAGSYTIALPAGMPDCVVTISGTSTSAIDPAVVTLPNAAIRLERADQVPVNTFTVATSTLAAYELQFVVLSGSVSRWSCAGDNFTPTTPASAVTFAPAGSVSSTTVQAAIAELDSEKTSASTMSLAEASVGTNTTGRVIGSDVLRGAIAVWAPGAKDYNVYASGTAYQLTGTSAALNFGTQDPVLTIPATATYRLTSRVNLLYNAATFAANRTVTLKLRKTSGTPADIANSTLSLTTDTNTTATGTFVAAELPNVGFSATAGDVITIFGDVSALPSAGSLDAVAASIIATEISQFSVVSGSAPTVTGVTVDTSGTSVAIEHSEPVTFGAGGSGGFVLTMSGGATTLSAPSGSGTPTLTYTSSRVIMTNETGTLDYTQPGNGVENLSGVDLATFTGTAVTNLSTQSGFSSYLAVLDGNDYMTTSGTPANWVDTNRFTLSAWIKFNATNGVRQDIVHQASNSRFSIRRSNGNLLTLDCRAAGGTQLLDVTTVNTLTTTNGWTHLYIAVDLTGGNTNNCRIYFDGTNQTFTVSTYVDGNMDMSASGGMRFGAGPSGNNKCSATFAEFWLDDVYLDSPNSFSTGTAGSPISLGANGQTPTGSPPAFYYSLAGSGDSWAADSSGSGNTATVTGAFGSADTPP